MIQIWATMRTSTYAAEDMEDAHKFLQFVGMISNVESTEMKMSDVLGNQDIEAQAEHSEVDLVALYQSLTDEGMLSASRTPPTAEEDKDDQVAGDEDETDESDAENSEEQEDDEGVMDDGKKACAEREYPFGRSPKGERETQVFDYLQDADGWITQHDLEEEYRDEVDGDLRRRRKVFSSALTNAHKKFDVIERRRSRDNTSCQYEYRLIPEDEDIERYQRPNGNGGEVKSEGVPVPIEYGSARHKTLDILDGDGRFTTSDIADERGIHRTSARETVVDLRDFGYVEKTGTKPSGGGRPGDVYSLTEAGKAELQRLRDTSE